jgi:HK97 gp10 family phage protein
MTFFLLEGDKKVAAAFKAAKKALPGAVKKGLDAGAFVVEGRAKTIVEEKDIFEFGFLKNSIHKEDVSDTQVAVEVGQHYGIYHEFGTYKMAARPYLLPALEESKDEVVKVIQHHVKAALK